MNLVLRFLTLALMVSSTPVAATTATGQMAGTMPEGMAGHQAMTGGEDTSQFDEQQALDYSQAAIGRTIGDHGFIDSSGNSVRLGDYAGKPLIISLIYTSCYHTCPMITASLLNAVEAAQDTFGRDAFSVVTIGFDVAVDTPQRMRAYGISHGVDLPNWRLLSGDKATIDALSADLGFIYFPSTKGYDHLAQTTLIDPAGKVFRHVYGDSFTVPNLMEPMKSLIFGEAASPFSLDGLVSKVRLFCTIYDPKSDRYRFDYSLFMAIILGVLCLGSIAIVLVREWLKTSGGSGGPGGGAGGGASPA